MRLLTILVLAWCSSAYTLGDRLLLQINHHSYTQRQLEAHTLVRAALQVVRQPDDTAIISAQRWRDLLDLFREDLLISLALERYDRYRPSTEDIAAARRYVLQKPTLMQAELVRLGIDDSTLTELIVVNLKINSYRLAQEKKTAATKPRWLQNIEQRHFVRFYRGSSIWMPIQPQRRDFSGR